MYWCVLYKVNVSRRGVTLASSYVASIAIFAYYVGMSDSVKNKKVFVGLSGGVDSSYSAYLLKQSGYDVVGVFIKTWQPDFVECTWKSERLDAMRVAAHLNIPFYTFDAEEVYRKEVGEYMISEYAAGRTPNPDVFCNREVKFGAFYKWARAQGADYIATGHYARVDNSDEGVRLLRGVDVKKDQSYFLWTLKEEILAHVFFPIGHLTKDEVRAGAEEAEIPVFAKKDSQGVCFLGPIDLEDFIEHFITLEEGVVIDDETGREIGRHRGAALYTIGQRHGFDVVVQGTGEHAHYVVQKNMAKNTITVSSTPPTLAPQSDVKICNVSCVRKSALVHGKEYMVQSRYRQNPFRITYEELGEGCGILHTQTEEDVPASGQSCVLYVEDECIGGGIVA